MKLELERVSACHPAASAGAAPALQGIDVRIGPGEQVALIGPSGAGKTTLLDVLACALRPVTGRFLLDGSDPWHLSAHGLRQRRQRLCLAPQVPPLPPRQRVITSVLAAWLPLMGFWSSLQSLLFPAEWPQVQQVLDRLDLSDKLYERVDRLSGGERQRVGLARAMLSLQSWPRRPALPGASLLLVDEPLSALDPARARQALRALTAAARDHRATLVASLHQVDLALASFPRVIGLRDGAVMFDLSAGQVSPAHLSALYRSHEHELQQGVHGAQP